METACLASQRKDLKVKGGKKEGCKKIPYKKKGRRKASWLGVAGARTGSPCKTAHEPQKGAIIGAVKAYIGAGAHPGP